MNENFKIACYQESYQELKKISVVKNLMYPNEKKNLDFSCDIGDCHMEYSMRLGVDFLTIRASRPYPGLTDSELTKMGEELTKESSVKFTAYSETIIFQLSLPLVGIADEDAKNKAIMETSKFTKFLLSLVDDYVEEPVTENIEEKKADTPFTGEDKGKLSGEEENLFEQPVQEAMEERGHRVVEEQTPEYKEPKFAKDTNMSSEYIEISNSNNKVYELREKTVDTKDDIFTPEISNAISPESKKESIPKTRNVESVEVIDSLSETLDYTHEPVTELSVHKSFKIADRKDTHEQKSVLPEQIDIPQTESKISDSSRKAKERREETETRRNELEFLINMRSENNRKQRELQSLQAELENRNKEIKEKEVQMEDKMQELNQEKQELQNKSTKFEELKKQMSDEKEALSKNLQDAKCSLEETRSSIKNLESQVRKLNDSIEKLKSKNGRLHEIIAEKEETILTLTKTIEEKELLITENGKWTLELQKGLEELQTKLKDKDLETESLYQSFAKNEKLLQEERQLELQAAKSDFEKKLQDCKYAYEKEKKNLYEKHESESKDLRTQHQTEISSLKEDAEQRIQELKTQYAKEKESVEIERQKQIQNLEEKYEQQKNAEIQAATKKHEMEIDSLVSDHNTEVINLNQKYLDEIQALTSELENCRTTVAKELSQKEEVLESSKNEFKEKYGKLEKMYDKATKELNHAKIELEKVTHEKDSVSAKLSDAEIQIEEYKKIISSKTSLIAELENRLNQYRDNGAELGMPDEVLEDFAETRKENRRLMREIQDLNKERETNEKSLLEQIEELTTQMKNKEKEDELEAQKHTPEAIRTKMVSDLAAIGVMVTPSLDDPNILKGKRDGCTIMIDSLNGMMICTKDVAKAAKYQNNIAKWNEEDITEFYYSTRKEIICRKKYNDAAMDITKVLRKLVLVK